MQRDAPEIAHLANTESDVKWLYFPCRSGCSCNRSVWLLSYCCFTGSFIGQIYPSALGGCSLLL